MVISLFRDNCAQEPVNTINLRHYLLQLLLRWEDYVFLCLHAFCLLCDIPMYGVLLVSFYYPSLVDPGYFARALR